MFLAWRYYSVNSTGMNDPEYPRGEIHKYNTCPGSVHHTYGHIYVQTLFGYICGYGNPDGSSAVTLEVLYRMWYGTIPLAQV